MEQSERIERIRSMEARLNRAEAALCGLEEKLEAFFAAQEDLRCLEAYYTSPVWRQDLEADEAGLLPAELRRGVLSEDGIDSALNDSEAVWALLRERSTSMNQTLEAIKNRRSIRKYTAEMPKREDLEAIIEAGLYAASGKGGQSSIIVAVTDRALRDRLMEMNRKVGGWQEGFDPFYGAPAVLIVLAKKDTPFTVADGSLSMGNMMLAASALGLGSCWINRAREEFESEEGKAILRELGIEGEWEGVGHCIVGYPDGEVPAAKPRAEGRVFWAE